VAKHVLNHFGVGSHHEQDARGSVAQIVYADVRKACLVEGAIQGSADTAGVLWPTLSIRKDEA
jgi:hypothetical protein